MHVGAARTSNQRQPGRARFSGITGCQAAASPEAPVGKHAPLEGKALAVIGVQLALCSTLAVQRYNQRVRVVLHAHA